MKYEPNRRNFLLHSLASTAGLGALSRFDMPNMYDTSDRYTSGQMSLDDNAPLTDDPRVKKLLAASIEAAMSSGASYADVRFTHTRIRNLGTDATGMSEVLSTGMSMTLGVPADSEEISIGVRALVNGYWGFASGPVWSLPEGQRLGREAADQAKATSLGPEREVNLSPTPPVKNGSWTTPVEIDPFTVHPNHLKNIMLGLQAYAVTRPYCISCYSQVVFERQDKAFCSSDNSYYTQRTYKIRPVFQISYREGQYKGEAFLDFLIPTALGFEAIDEEKVRNAIDPALEQLARGARTPIVVLDVGRYETVLDARSVATLLSETIGPATEVDRAMGYEANAGGTSYLNEPQSMLGSAAVAAKVVSVSANRSEHAGLATVQWDDEGVTPQTTQLITDGLLTNFQSNREGSGWLSKQYSGRDITSSGCAYAPVGVQSPMAHSANLQLHPGTEANDFDSMVKSVKRGIACTGLGGVSVDFQKLNGMAIAGFYEIRNGKIIARIANSAFMFRTPELWKGIRAIGDSSTTRSYGSSATKGEPPQKSEHTVTAVPALHEALSYIDPSRKA